MRGAPSAAPFLSPGFGSPEARARAVSEAAARPADAGLLEAAEAELGAGRPGARAALEALPRGAAVVTGQQAGLLLGPLYTFHKALGALEAAAELERASGVPVAAVFWVQDEDHDFAEVARASWLSESGALRSIELPDDSPRVSVGDRPLPPGLGAALEPFLADLKGAPHEAEAAHLVEPWRGPGTWSAAFTECLRRVFADEPLVIVRGRHPAVAQSARALVRRALVDCEAWAEAIDEASCALSRAGFRVQIDPRPRCALAFHHPEGEAGARFRPERVQGGFRVPGDPRVFALDALLERLERSPTSFSTSALLRVLVQDDLLPVAVQMLGPGEAAYLGQLGSLRARAGVPSPLPAPRASARWLEPVVRRRLRELGIDADRATGDPELLLAELDPSHEALAPSALRAQLFDPLARALDELGPLEPKLDEARETTRAAAERQIARFVGRVARREAERSAVAARRLAEVRARILPGGEPQERRLGLIPLVARHGLSRLKACFRASYSPFDPRRMELEP